MAVGGTGVYGISRKKAGIRRTKSLQLTNQLLRDRDHKQLKTHIGKGKSHTDVEYNETADKAARAVVDGENSPDITFEDADPPIGGLRTWPHIRHNPTNRPEHIRKLTNLKAGF